MSYFLLIIALWISRVNGGPPVFIQQPIDATATDGRLVFNCTAGAGGAPPPYISWYRGNPPLLLSAFSGLSVLNISNVVDGVDASVDGIQYHCRATNSYGTIRSRTAMGFIAVFDGFQNEKNTTLNVENTMVSSYLDTVALYCNISRANPFPSIVWVNDLGQIVPNDGVTYTYVEGGRYLVIINVGTSLVQRTFHCRVTNAFGGKTVDSKSFYKLNASGNSSAQLIIYKPLKDVTAYDGDTNVNFSLVAASRGITSVSYSVYSKPPGSSLGSSLSTQGTVLGVIPGPVSVNDSGTVVACFVNYGLNAQFMVVQYTATLTVLASPSLVSYPSNSLDNFERDSASFTCTYLVAPGITLSWYKDGVQLNSSNSPHLQFSGTSLNIPSLFVDDSGMYQCSVSNGTNSIWANWAVVVRRSVLAVLSQSLSSPLVVSTGSNMTLVYQVQADPIPSVQWYLNGSLIQDSSVYRIPTITEVSVSMLYNISLMIASVSPQTQGYYSVTLISRGGVVSSSSVFVTPPVPAQVLGVAVPSCLQPGSILKVQCNTYGYPLPAVQFAVNNIAISPTNGRIGIINNSLIISTATPDDGGLYCCQASNGLGTSTATLSCSSIPVCGYPVLTIGISDSLTLGNSVNLTCNDAGNLPSTFSWTKDGHAVIEDSHLNVVTLGRYSTLVFSGLRSADEGKYTCNTTNLLGSSTLTYAINLNSKAEILPSYGTIIFIVGVGVLLALVPITAVACYFNGRRKTSRYNMDAIGDSHNQEGTVTNMDKSSIPEPFSPQYDSLPVSEVRPVEPPLYKPTPPYAVEERKDHIELEMVDQSLSTTGDHRLSEVPLEMADRNRHSTGSHGLSETPHHSSIGRLI